MQTSFLLEPWSYYGRNVAAGTCNSEAELRSTALKRHDCVGNGCASQLPKASWAALLCFFSPLSRSRAVGFWPGAVGALGP